MNTAAATCGKATRELFQQAALPLPFAVRAGRSTPLLATGLQPPDAGDPNQSTELHIRTRLLLASLFATCQR